MRLNLTINNNIISKFIKDDHINQCGIIVDELVNAKLTGGTIEYNETTVNASEIQSITIEF